MTGANQPYPRVGGEGEEGDCKQGEGFYKATARPKKRAERAVGALKMRKAPPCVFLLVRGAHCKRDAAQI